VCIQNSLEVSLRANVPFASEANAGYSGQEAKQEMQFNEKRFPGTFVWKMPKTSWLQSYRIEQSNISRHGHRAGCILLGVLLVAGMPACGKRPVSDEDYPPPGHMRLLSMEAANSVYSARNLIHNGDFSVWYAGAPVPDGFVAPGNTKITKVNRQEPRGGPGRFSADQYWYASDAGEGLLDLFHTLVPGIEAGKAYEFFVQYRVYDQTTVSISMVLLDASGTPQEFWPDAMVTEPGHEAIKTCSIKFRPTIGGTLAIVPHTNEKTSYRARTIWQLWRLTATALQEGEAVVPAQPFPAR